MIGQNGPVSVWAGIESSPDAGRGDAAAPPLANHPDPRRIRPDAPSPNSPSGRVAGARRRLRRQQRPVLGSIDTAGALLQRHAREVVVGSAFIVLPGVLVNLVAASLAFDRYENFSGAVASVPEMLGGSASSTGVEQILWFVGVLVNSLAACLVGGYVATLAVRAQRGAAVSIRTGYSALWRRLPALVVAWAIGHCWVPFAVWIIAAVDAQTIGLAILFGVSTAWLLTTLTVLVAPTIVIERLGPLRGFARAWRLARSRFSILFAFVGASFVVGVFVQYGIASLPRLLQQSGFVALGRFGWLIEGVAGQLGRLISVPLIAMATALVYLDVRVSAEGMDLVDDAERAFGGGR